MEHNNTASGAKVSISPDIANVSDDKIQAIGNELESKLVNDIDEYEIDLSVEYPEPKFTLSITGVGTLPRGDIQAIKAKSKNGKSFLCSVFISSLFGCNDFGFITKETAPVALYFDTEQNKRNTARLMKCVHTLLDWDIKKNRNEFHVYALRTMEMQSRLPYIERVIKERKPTIAFIDGIADLIQNFNDVEQSTQLINGLMKLSGENDCCVCCVLHTNKGKDDSSMKGHLGTMLLQKASDVFEVIKNGNTFNVTETDCRNQPVEDFAFSIDGHGIPMPAATQKDSREQQRVEGITKNLKEVFADAGELSFNEFVKAYALIAAVSESTAKRVIRISREKNLINVTPNGKYSLS